MAAWEPRARLAYRDAHVFPQLDLTATAGTTMGLWDVRAMGNVTLAPEDGDNPVRGNIGINAGLYDEDRILDLSANYDITRDRGVVGAQLFRYHPTWDIATSTTLSAMSKAPEDENFDPRAKLEFDLSKPINLNGAAGHLGLFGSAAADFDGKDEEFRVGAFFRLDF